MKTSTIIAGAAAIAVVAIAAFYFFDVDSGSVNVGSEEKTVLVPKIVMEEEKITVPTIDVEPAKEN